MNDALLEEIQAAYRTHKLWPMHCIYYFKGFACPLTALAISRGVVDKNDPRLETDEDENLALAWACREFGADWVEGFVNAFDGGRKGRNDPDYLAGYECGKLAFKQLFPRPKKVYR